MSYNTKLVIVRLSIQMSVYVVLLKLITVLRFYVLLAFRWTRNVVNFLCKMKSCFQVRYYLPPIKLSCGKVLSSQAIVCSQGGPEVAIIHDALDITVQPPPICTPPNTHIHQTPYYQHQVTNIGDLFKLVHLKTPWDRYLVVATEAHTTCKWVVSILLESYLSYIL